MIASLCCFSMACALSAAASLCFLKFAFAVALCSASLLVASALALLAAFLFATFASAALTFASATLFASAAAFAAFLFFASKALAAAFLCASAALFGASARASFAFGGVVVVFVATGFFAVVWLVFTFVSALYASFALAIAFLACSFSSSAVPAATWAISVGLLWCA